MIIKIIGIIIVTCVTSRYLMSAVNAWIKRILDKERCKLPRE